MLYNIEIGMYVCTEFVIWNNYQGESPLPSFFFRCFDCGAERDDKYFVCYFSMIEHLLSVFRSKHLATEMRYLSNRPPMPEGVESDACDSAFWRAKLGNARDRDPHYVVLSCGCDGVRARAKDLTSPMLDLYTFTCLNASPTARSTPGIWGITAITPSGFSEQRHVNRVIAEELAQLHIGIEQVFDAYDEQVFTLTGTQLYDVMDSKEGPKAMCWKGVSHHYVPVMFSTKYSYKNLYSYNDSFLHFTAQLQARCMPHLQHGGSFALW